MSVDLAGLVSEAASLLHGAGEERWRQACEHWRAELSSPETDPRNVAREFLAAYGGMGSFNDLVLYRDGRLLGSETESLDRLRGRIFDVCRSLLTGAP